MNIIDTEDAVKYMPSVFLRKRNNGDTQATMATRVWGVSSSARSPDLRRRRAAHGAHREQQHHRRSAMGTRLAGGNRAHRHDVRPVLRRVRRQLDGRRHGDHDAACRTRSRARSNRRRRLQRFSLYGTQQDLSAPRRPTATSAIGSGSSRSGRAAIIRTATASRSAYVTARNVSDRHHGRLRRAEQARRAPPNVLGATGLLHTRA